MGHTWQIWYQINVSSEWYSYIIMAIQILIDKVFLLLGIFKYSRSWLCFFILIIIKEAAASNGDRSYIFLKCVSNCGNANCTKQSNFVSLQPWYLWLLQWSCKDECRYQCMWKTVDAFKKDNIGVPQFYGKVCHYLMSINMGWLGVMVFNATLSNISLELWRSF